MNHKMVGHSYVHQEKKVDWTLNHAYRWERYERGSHHNGMCSIADITLDSLNPELHSMVLIRPASKWESDKELFGGEWYRVVPLRTHIVLSPRERSHKSANDKPRRCAITIGLVSLSP